MARLTEEMKKLIEEVKLCVVATTDKAGMPNASFRGSLQIMDDEHLIFAEIFADKTKKNLQENNKICILVSDHKKMIGYQFKGEAELLNQGELYDQVCSAIEGFKRNFPKPSCVVKAKITEIFPAPAAR